MPDINFLNSNCIEFEKVSDAITNILNRKVFANAVFLNNWGKTPYRNSNLSWRSKSLLNVAIIERQSRSRQGKTDRFCNFL